MAHAAGFDERALAASCATCHQPGESRIPSLDGQSRDELAAKLRGFRDGSRSGTVMPQLAKGYTEAQLDALAAHFGARRVTR
jgi:cytochrome c553